MHIRHHRHIGNNLTLPHRTTVTTHTLDSLQPGPVAISRHNILYAVHTGPQDVGGAVLGVVPCTLIRVVLQAGTVPPRIRGPVVLGVLVVLWCWYPGRGVWVVPCSAGVSNGVHVHIVGVVAIERSCGAGAPPRIIGVGLLRICRLCRPRFWGVVWAAGRAADKPYPPKGVLLWGVTLESSYLYNYDDDDDSRVRSLQE